MGSFEKPYAYYPDYTEIDKWVEEIWHKAETVSCKAEPLPDWGWRNEFGTFHARTQIVKFQPDDLPAFYGVWQSAFNSPAPLVVHLPGYGGELSVHPDVASQGFNVLNLSPMGYWTPNGFDESKRDKEINAWPVLPDTLRSNREHGYKDWLRCVVYAVKWAWTMGSVMSDRVSFYGTSQGGGSSVLAASVFKDHGVRCVASDEPYLTDYPLADLRGGYEMLKYAVAAEESKEVAYSKLAVVDTIAHTHRIQCPILLTTGTADVICPPETVYKLDSRLDGTHSMVTFKDRPHGYSYDFIRLAETWLKLYA